MVDMYHAIGEDLTNVTIAFNGTEPVIISPLV